MTSVRQRVPRLAGLLVAIFLLGLQFGCSSGSTRNDQDTEQEDFIWTTEDADGGVTPDNMRNLPLGMLYKQDTLTNTFGK